MRNLLLTSAAVAALLAGTALASAETRQDQSQQPPAASQKSSPQARVNEEKGKRAGDHKETSGPTRDQSSQNGKAKSNDKAAASERSTTGASESDNKPNAAEKAQSKESNKGSGAMQRSDRKEGAKTDRSSASDKKHETTGNAQNQGNSGEQKAGTSKTNSSAQKSDRSTSGQSPSNTGNNAANPPSQSNSRESPSAKSGQSNNAAPGQTGSQQSGSQQSGSQQNTQNNARGGTSSTTASVEQQTKFNAVIRQQNIKPVTNVNFSVSVGTAIPTSVHVHDVPRDIVTIYPEYRGKKFVVVRDEIVIIEPGTRKIVSVIPRSGRTTTGATTSTTTKSSRLNLAPEKRRMIRETVIKEQSAPRCSDLTVAVGETVSSSLRLDPLPSVVVQEVPQIKSYEFCIKDDDVVLIDPSEHRIIDVID